MTTLAQQEDAAANKYGIDPKLFRALVNQESGGNQKAVSPTGARGLTQLEPATAAALGVNPDDAAQNLDGGAHYLREQLDTFGGNTSEALAAYNAGPAAVKKYGGIPPFAETQNYVKSILAAAGSGIKNATSSLAGVTGSTDAAGTATAATDTSAASDSGGLFGGLAGDALKAMIWIVLIVGGGGLAILGAGRIANGSPA